MGGAWARQIGTVMTEWSEYDRSTGQNNKGFDDKVQGWMEEPEGILMESSDGGNRGCAPQRQSPAFPSTFPPSRSQEAFLEEETFILQLKDK